jgi:hypothetical protein
MAVWIFWFCVAPVNGRNANRCSVTIAMGRSRTSPSLPDWDSLPVPRPPFGPTSTGPAQLFLNKGDGTFTDISFVAGVSNDGYVDLYVSNLNGQNFLYHNNHGNTFTEVAAKAGVPGSGKGFATWFFD